MLRIHNAYEVTLSTLPVTANQQQQGYITSPQLITTRSILELNKTVSRVNVGGIESVISVPPHSTNNNSCFLFFFGYKDKLIISLNLLFELHLIQFSSQDLIFFSYFNLELNKLKCLSQVVAVGSCFSVSCLLHLQHYEKSSSCQHFLSMLSVSKKYITFYK